MVPQGEGGQRHYTVRFDDGDVQDVSLFELRNILIDEPSEGEQLEVNETLQNESPNHARLLPAARDTQSLPAKMAKEEALASSSKGGMSAARPPQQQHDADVELLMGLTT